ncbi:MAG: bifunctional metallophosphatase/5'-nucleotidase [Mobilitalea sp.]
MRKIISLSVLWLISVSMILQTIYIPTVFAAEQEKTVTILFTHDLHDNLLPVQTIENGTAVYLGGYARLQSAINAQKLEDPEALLVDGGDFSMGTPFQTIYQSDAPELRILGAMGYDVVTLGNHEYDYRAKGLTGSLLAAIDSGDKLPQIVQSNVIFPTDDEGNLTQSLTELKQSMENYGVKDYTIIERNGAKIGIFGLMGEESESMAPMSEVTFEDEIEQAKRVVKILKEQEQVDLILCLSHSGTNDDKSKSEDEILAKEVPEINVIISGHSHTKLSQPIMIGDTIIASAEDYGKSLGVIKVSQNQDGSWELSNYELVQIDDSFLEDSLIQEQVAVYKSIVQEKYFDKFNMDYDEVVATSTIQFQTPAELFDIHAESTLGNLISDAYLYSVKKAEGDNYIPIAATIVPCGTIRGTIFKGDITTADAFSISSLGIGADGMPGYPLISVYLSGKELKTVCEVDASITSIMGDAQLYMSGMNFVFNPNRLIFNKVTKTALINPDKTEEVIDDTKLYRIVCGLYSAQMLSVVGDKSFGLMSVNPKTKEGDVITDFEEYILYDTVNGVESELKEWYAVVQYLQSFEKVEGVSQVSSYYQETQGRKIVDDDNNILALVSNPNHISLTVYIVVPVILILIIFLITRLVRRSRRKKNRK